MVLQRQVQWFCTRLSRLRRCTSLASSLTCQLCCSPSFHLPMCRRWWKCYPLFQEHFVEVVKVCCGAGRRCSSCWLLELVEVILLVPLERIARDHSAGPPVVTRREGQQEEVEHVAHDGHRRLHFRGSGRQSCWPPGRDQPATAQRGEEFPPRSAARCGRSSAAQAPAKGLAAPPVEAPSVPVGLRATREPPPPWLWRRCSLFGSRLPFSLRVTSAQDLAVGSDG